MAVILQAQHLVKSFHSNIAVNDVSFEIHSGEIFSLLGPNGAGKTTTISMLSTLLKPTSGDAFIGGHSVTSDPMAVRQLIGLVPQEIALYEDLAAFENLLFFGRMYGMSGNNLKTRAHEILEQVGLDERAKDRVKTFSGGMKRRLNIGIGLLHRPQLIFMDEPTVGIDPQSRRRILDSVKELNKQGLTVLYTTHYMEEAQELSNRVGIIDHGQLIACGTQKELTQLVGENDTLRLHLNEETDPANLTMALSEVTGVIQATTTDHQIILITPEAEEILPQVISSATALNIKIRSIDIQEPNLEAVFLHITGRALRD